MVENETLERYLGRYEHEDKRFFVEYAKSPDSDTIHLYSYGTVGFTPVHTLKVTFKDMVVGVEYLLSQGYVKTDEKPISEDNSADAKALLDWIGGITR